MEWSLESLLESILKCFFFLFFFILFKMAFCFIYKNSDYNLLPIEGIIWRIDYIKIYCSANDGNLIVSPMIKTDIIGFGQKINRTVKLVELSDTLTQYRRWRHGWCRGGGGGGWVGRGGARVPFLPLIFFKPIFF